MSNWLQGRQSAHTLTRWLIEPGAAVRESESRRSAQLLAGLLLIWIPLAAISLLYPPLGSYEEILFILIAFIATYPLSRTVYHRASAALVVFVVGIYPFLLVFNHSDQIANAESAIAVLVWLVVGIASSSVLFSASVSLMLLLADLLALIALGLLHPTISLTTLIPSTVLLLALGVLIIAAFFVRDRDRRLIQEQAGSLVESEQRFRRLFEATVDGIALCDNGTIVDVNPRFETLFGYKTKQVVGMSIGDLFDQTPKANAGSLTTTSDGTNKEEEQGIARRRDGTTFPVDLVVRSGYQYQGRRIEIIAFHDITVRRRAETAMIKAKDAAESAARAKTRFLTNMSHEMRTPLNAVVGMTDLLLDSDLGPQQRDFVEIIRDSGDALESIIVDVLDIARIEDGAVTLEKKEFDLRACVESALDFVAGAAGTKRLDTVCSISPSVPSVVIGDSARIRQVMVQLLDNAIKFTDKGEVVLKVESQAEDELEADAEGLCSLHFSIRDTGIGIPESSKAALFRPFSQLDVSSTRRYGGTGLGLAICHALVKMMDGEIWVESKEGVGSTFHFQVSLPDAARTLTPYRALSQPVIYSARALIVDDSPAVCATVSGDLQSWGIDTEIASSGVAVRELARHGESFDIVLLDIDIADVDDVVIATLTRERRNAKGAPLVLFDYRDPERKERASTVASEILIKPIRASRLQETVLRILEEFPRHSGRLDSEVDKIEIPEEAVSSEPAPLRILVVEDNPVNQKLMRLLLGRLGHQPDVAANGRIAVEWMAKQRYDIVFMDLQMPEMDGIEATRRVRFGLPSDEQPHIVAVTADVLPETRERCLEIGMDGYLTKPVQSRHLKSVLRKFGNRGKSNSLGRDDERAQTAEIVDLETRRAQLKKQS